MNRAKYPPSPTGSEAEPLVSTPLQSTWTLPGSVVLLYVLAILMATTHLLMFHYLDGKRLGIDTDMPQSWIAPISLLFGLAFRGALCACLSTAFSQHMWRIMMSSILSVETIDRLYSLQRNVFAIFHLDNIRASPALFLLVCLYWLIPLAVVFPSGALVVEGGLHPSFQGQVKIPTFNPADLGNGTLVDAINHSLAPNEDLYDHATLEGPVRRPNYLSSNAAISLVSERIFTTGSPCGPNCTYAVDFDGPIVHCNQTTRNATFSDTDSTLILHNEGEFSTFNGDWENGSGWKPLDSTSPNVSVVPATFTFTTHPPYVWKLTPNSTNNTYTIQQTTELTCTPGKARYEVNVNYTSGSPMYKVKTTFLEDLIDFWFPYSLNITDDNPSIANNEPVKNNLRATNLWLLIDSLVGSLAGEMNCSESDVSSNITFENVTTPDGQTLTTSDGRVIDCFVATPANSTIVHQTPFNTRRFTTTDGSPEFKITEDNLNAALVNITLSVFNRQNMWSTTTDVTQQNWANFYRFKDPARLIIPYFLALALCLPFLFLGFISLRRNGVAAPTDRMVDMLVLGATSEGIRDAAKGITFQKGHGYGQGVERIRKMNVRYGEVVEGDGSKGIKMRRLNTESSSRI